MSIMDTAGVLIRASECLDKSDPKSHNEADELVAQAISDLQEDPRWRDMKNELHRIPCAWEWDDVGQEEREYWAGWLRRSGLLLARVGTRPRVDG